MFPSIWRFSQLNLKNNLNGTLVSNIVLFLRKSLIICLSYLIKKKL